MDAPTPPAGRTLIDQLLGLTFNLVQADDPIHPTAPSDLASGFLIAKAGQLYLLTAGHVANQRRPWFWEFPLEAHRGCLLVPLGPFIRYAAAAISPGGGMVIQGGRVPAADFAWAPFDPVALSAKLRAFPGPKAPLTYEYYHGPLDQPPQSGSTCVLAAQNRATLYHGRLTYLHREPCVQDLVFQSTNAKGHHMFHPSGGHQGHDFYRGASGAPIMNETGHLVSMLIGGDEKVHEIYGQPLPLIAHLSGFDPTGT
ncbi:MAG TPA: hypothetical protein VG734_17385 [Lacunisphaera sp.]|nr:hypothetical protein [Lacunisphaera sp.]